jgi:hypothetical protein
VGEHEGEKRFREQVFKKPLVGSWEHEGANEDKAIYENVSQEDSLKNIFSLLSTPKAPQLFFLVNYGPLPALRDPTFWTAWQRKSRQMEVTLQAVT